MSETDPITAVVDTFRRFRRQVARELAARPAVFARVKPGRYRVVEVADFVRFVSQSRRACAAAGMKYAEYDPAFDEAQYLLGDVLRFRSRPAPGPDGGGQAESAAARARWSVLRGQLSALTRKLARFRRHVSAAADRVLGKEVGNE